MKKITGIIAFMLMISFTCVNAEELLKDGFRYTKEGVVTYHEGGNDVLSIPDVMDGVKITKINDYAFGESGYETVYLPEGLLEIGVNAFEHGCVKYIDIPKTVEKIGERAFYRADMLEDVVLHNDEIIFGKEAFAKTGKIAFTVSCTEDIEKITEKIKEAKGDDNFTVEKMHCTFTKSMIEKDIHGNPVYYCDGCGQKMSDATEDSGMAFTDVSPDSWYYPYVSTAYLFGIINGKGNNIYDPNANMTIAEAVKISASIHAYMNDVKIVPLKDGKWYDTYVKYCYDNSIIDKSIQFDWEKVCTRGEMAYIFAGADDKDYEINPDVPLTDIPDVTEDTPYHTEILELYRQGIATGSDENMTFYPDAFVKRSEAAAFVSRIICYDMRVLLPKG